MRPDIDLNRAIVCIPAKDEAERIGNMLRSLSQQKGLSTARPLKVVVVCNNTTDGTADRVRSFATDGKLAIRLIEVDLPLERAHVGTARRMAMDAAADWSDSLGADDSVLLSTDADGIVPSHWVAANLEALRNADVVGGRLVIAEDDAETSPALRSLHRQIEHYWEAVRALEDCIDLPVHDPAPRHGDHTGASLALRTSLYHAVGGLPPLPFGEDNALVAAIEAWGGRLRHCPHVWVEVSAREKGRAAGGMAREMIRRRETISDASAYELPAATHWMDRLSRRAKWRAEWSPNDKSFVNAIAYVAHHEARAQTDPAPLQPLDDALASLEAMVDAYRLRRSR